MTATTTITLAFEIEADAEYELPTIDDIRGALENRDGHGLPRSWWSRDRGYWIIAISAPPQPAEPLAVICGGLLDACKGLLPLFEAWEQTSTAEEDEAVDAARTAITAAEAMLALPVQFRGTASEIEIGPKKPSA